MENIESGETKPEWSTFTWLPEIYKVGFLELFAALYPDWEQTFDLEADRLAAMPSLRPLVNALAGADDDVRLFVMGGAKAVRGSSGGSDGSDGAARGDLRTRNA